MSLDALEALRSGAGRPAPAAGVPVLEVRGVRHGFATPEGSPLPVLDGVNLSVAEGEFVALVGPSGAGKSTLLGLIAALDAPAGGEVLLRGDARATRLGRVGYMPQRDLLLPWRTALGNAIAGLEVRGVPRAEARGRALALFETFGLSAFAGAYPHALSGGMRQRVAFVRSLLATDELLLLDEPFGALDALTRASLQRWLLEVWSRLRLSCLLVTHDVDEALFLADRIYVLSPRPGRIVLEAAVPLERPRAPGDLARADVALLKARVLAALAGAEA
jgi:ABC-type nitrate/sulfonate/bicarbonate transport system ATPase subunit